MNAQFSLPKLILHFESLIFLISALVFYQLIGANWSMFFLLFFLPDISALAYITKNKRIGAIIYNMFHNYLLVMILVFFSLYIGDEIWMSYAIILFAHINFDRLIGYGLRYTDVFRVTHMQKV